MNTEYGAKPITCPKPVLRRRVWSSYALEPVVNLDFQWARRHPAHQRAYEDGYESGIKSLLRSLEKNLEDRFEKGVEKGMNLGRGEGYTVAKEGFDEIIKVTRAREAAKARTLVEKGVDARLAPTIAVSTQTNALNVTALVTMSIYTQMDIPNPISHATTHHFVQMDPISTRESRHVIHLPSSSPISIPATPSVYSTTIGTKTDTAMSQHLGIGFHDRVATSQADLF